MGPQRRVSAQIVASAAVVLEADASPLAPGARTLLTLAGLVSGDR